jgi:hypothetical protein
MVVFPAAEALCMGKIAIRQTRMREWIIHLILEVNMGVIPPG